MLEKLKRNHHHPADAPPGEEVELDETELLVLERERRRIMKPLTKFLLVLLIASLGVVAGVRIQKSEGSSTAASGLPAGFTLPTGAGSGRGSGFPSLAALGGGSGGLPGAATGGAATGAGSGSSIGTVKLVDGNNVYVQDFSGNVTKLVLAPDASVTVSKPGSVADLTTGQTVSYQGTKGSDGSISASSISGVSGLGGSSPQSPGS